MATKNMIKFITRSCAVILVSLCVIGGIAANAWATHEILKATSSSNVAEGIKTRWTEDLAVQWERPAISPDTLKGYYYLWNSTGTSLNSEDIAFAGFTVPMTGTVPDVTSPYASKPKAELASLDSGSELFLHVITHYQLSGGGEERVSQDVVFGPFWIDNVAPTGTVRIVDASGNDISSTPNTTVKIKLAASSDTVKAYLNESEAILTSLHIDPYAADAEYSFANIGEGEKTVYAWFEDGVGNVSSVPVTDKVILSGKYINPGSVTIYLPTGSEQVSQSFRVEGTTAAYNWTITNEVPESVGETVASIAGSPGNNITVTPLHKGTFQLHAVPVGGATTDNPALDSDTITVAQSYIPGDVNGDGIIDVSDVIKIVRASLDLTNTSPFISAAADINNDGIIDVSDVIKAVRLSLDLPI